MKTTSIPHPIWTIIFLFWAVAVIWIEFSIETSDILYLRNPIFGEGLKSEKFWFVIVIAPPLAVGGAWVCLRTAFGVTVHYLAIYAPGRRVYSQTTAWFLSRSRRVMRAIF